MAEVLEQEREAAIKRPLDARGSALVAVAKALAVADAHQRFLAATLRLRARARSEWIASFAEEKGP